MNRTLRLALGIILARSLGAEGYGVYAYAFAIMSLLLVVAEAGVPTLLMREVAAGLSLENWGLLRGALIRGGQFVGLVSISVSAIGLLVLWWRADNLSGPVLYTTALMLLVLPISALCKTISHALRGLHRVVLGQAVNMLIRPLLVVLLVGICFLLWPNLHQPQYAMAAQLTGATVVLLVGIFILRHYLPLQAKTATPEYRSRNWIKSALPFTLIGGAGVINNHADMVMLGWFVDPESVGAYQVAVQGGMTILFFLHAANSVVGPYFARLYGQDKKFYLERLYRKAGNYTLAATLPLFLVFFLYGNHIIGYIFGEDFIEGYYSLVILSAGQFFLVMAGSAGTLLQMCNKEVLAAKALYVSAVLNILFNLMLIPIFGIEGAALANMASNAFISIFLISLLQKSLGFRRVGFCIKDEVNG
jgi:O-antigen/teichoic acid export membrane protein